MMLRMNVKGSVIYRSRTSDVEDGAPTVVEAVLT